METQKLIEVAVAEWADSAVHLLFEIEAVVQRHERQQTGEGAGYAALRDALAEQVTTYMDAGDWSGLATSWQRVFDERRDTVSALYMEDSEMPVTLFEARPSLLVETLLGRGPLFESAVADATPTVPTADDEDAPF